jgi:hypothetical protein
MILLPMNASNDDEDVSGGNHSPLILLTQARGSPSFPDDAAAVPLICWCLNAAADSRQRCCSFSCHRISSRSAID